MNTLLVVGIAVTGMSLLLAIIATSIPFWWRVSAEGWHETMNFGLFQVCRYTTSDEVCTTYEQVSSWLRAVQAMMVMCILALAASVGLSVMFAFIIKDKTVLALGGAFMAMAGAFMGLLGVIIYAVKMPDSLDIIAILSVLKGGLHAGFGLAVVAVVLAVISPVLLFLSRDSN